MQPVHSETFETENVPARQSLQKVALIVDEKVPASQFEQIELSVLAYEKLDRPGRHAGHVNANEAHPAIEVTHEKAPQHDTRPASQFKQLPLCVSDGIIAEVHPLHLR
jgi:hypothetical protein